MNTSFSALSTFQTCPRKYKYQELDKIRTPKNPDAVFGTLVHSTMKFIHSGNFVLPTLKEALNYFSTNWDSDVFSDEIKERAAFAQGIRIIQEYYKRNDPNKTNIVDVESRFTIEVKDPETNRLHLISGIIDRIDKTEDGFEIIDYKTSSKLPPQSSIDDNMQLLIYLLAFLKRYPNHQDLSNVKLSLLFLKHGAKLTTTKDTRQLELGKQELIESIGRIETSDFSPVVNPLCDWCGHQRICPMWKHKFKDEKLQPIGHDEAAKLINEFLLLNDKMKTDRIRIAQLKKILLGIMEQEGVERLFGEGKIIAKTARKTYHYDEKVLKQLLEPEGLWDSATKIDTAKLKKIIETLPAVMKKKIESTRQLGSENWSLSIKKQP